MVGTSGIEPPTTTMSRWCSTTELRAYEYLTGGKDTALSVNNQVENTPYRLNKASCNEWM